ncbi:hypothetical protein BYT27DRAFT_7335731 [Phlegmacium glaucopus]|nr:hypothetical protein BYT27DRAFT_7335731 [Phlegmacium glaucopus]
MTKTIAKKSGFYVGLLGSPGWETKRSLFIRGGPERVSLPPEGYTASCRRLPSGSSMTTILHKMPALCDITSTRPAPSDVFRDKLQPLHISVLSPELSRPFPVMVPPKRPNPYFDPNSSFPTRRLSSLLITQDDQHGDFQSNENITLNSRPRNLVLVSGLNSLQSRTHQSKVSSVSSADFEDERRLSDTYAVDIAVPTRTFRTSVKHATDLFENNIQQSTIGPLHFGSMSKRCARTISENSQQSYSDNANDLILNTADQDFSDVSPPKASHKIPASPKLCPQFVDLSNNSVRLKPQCSSLSKRTRNSPIIGPSPLRTMSLPSDYDVEHITKFNADDCSTSSNIQSEAKFEPSFDSPPSSSHSSPISMRSKTVLRPNDSDSILDLIRELAQETSSWDAGLFVDENFKAMMDQSKIHPRCELKIQRAQSKYRRNQRRTTPFIPLQDIPESDVAIVFSEENDNYHPDEAQSFWQDEIDSAYQHNAQPQSPSLSGPFAY